MDIKFWIAAVAQCHSTLCCGIGEFSLIAALYGGGDHVHVIDLVCVYLLFDLPFCIDCGGLNFQCTSLYPVFSMLFNVKGLTYMGRSGCD